MTEDGTGPDGERYTRITTTDARGDFTLPPDMPWGVLTVRAEQKPAGIAVWGPTSVAPGATVQVDLQLDEGARLAGVVRLADGAPAAGARVAVLCPEDGRGMLVDTITGPDGRYELRGLPPGGARIAAMVGTSAPRFEDGFSRAQLKTHETTTLDLEAVRGAVIRGVVRLPDGRPAGGAIVLASVSAEKPWPERARRAVADGEGTFEISELASGHAYHLWADVPGYRTAHVPNVTGGERAASVRLASDPGLAPR
jgi:hypothetical protein